MSNQEGRDGSRLAARLDDVSEHLQSLQRLLDEEEHLDAVLDRLAAMAVKMISGACQVSITVSTGERTRTAAATQQSAIDIDRIQYDSGQGPCVEAARQRHPVQLRVADARSRWPAFAQAADAAGLRAYLSAPLALDGEEPVLGAVNISSDDPDAFDLLEQALLSLFTTAASAAIINARRSQRFRQLAEDLAAALTSRADIDQAKGVLMERHGLDAEQAFKLLTTQSQATQVKVRELSRNLLDSIARSPVPD